MNLRHALLCLLMALAVTLPAAAGAPQLDEKKVLAAMKIVMYQEPCCGACPRLTPDQGRRLLGFLKGEASTGGQALWKTYGDALLKQLDPVEAERVKTRVASLTAATSTTEGVKP